MSAIATPPVEAPAAPLREPGARALALVGATGAVVLAIVAVSVVEGDPSGSDWIRATLVAAWGAAGGLLSWRGQARLGGAVVIGALVGGACAATGSEASLADVHMIAAALVPAAALHIELTLPDGLTPGRRKAVLIGYATAAAAGLALAVAGRTPSTYGVAAAVVVALLLGLPPANQRYMTSAGLVRQRLQLVGCAVAVVIEVALVVAALHLLVDWPRPAGSVAAAATALIPLALIGTTSARLARRVDRVLVHTVSITGLTAVVLAVYLVIVIGLGRVPTGQERNLLVLSMAAAGVAAIVYVPARERLAETANRLVYGERHPPDEVLRTWGSRLSRAIPMDELLLQLAESLRKVLALHRAEVWTGTDGRLDLAVSVPDREAPTLVLGPKERPVVARAGVSGNAWAEVWLPQLLEGRSSSQIRIAPASHSGELLGLLVIERAGDGDQFTEEDDRVLAELARQVGLALHNVELDSALQESLDEVRRTNEELQASRARIVATADAERRKIERNLHDGAQQHLVALAVNLRLAKDILADDPETAAEMLDQLANDVRDTVQELRDLAHGIYPPLLMDSGLPEALRAAGNRNPLPVTVEAEGIGRYGAEIEAAVYFCCLEALQNAAKHAGESAEVKVTVTEADGELRFEVSDNGPGFDVATAAAGHGYVNMSDRLGAIGGSVEWRSAPGEGATIIGRLPLS